MPDSTKPKVWGGGGGGVWPSLSHNSSAAFIASLRSSGFATADNHHLIHAVNTYNGLVPPSDIPSHQYLPSSLLPRRDLSPISWIVWLSVVCMTHLLQQTKLALLSASASLATSWISVLPLGEPGLHFYPNEFCTAITWWLGLETKGFLLSTLPRNSF